MRWNPFRRRPDQAPQVEGRAVTAVPWDVGGAKASAVGQDQALSMFAVYGCVRILANSVASLPLKAYRKVGEARQPLPDLPPLLRSPSIHGTLYNWLHRMVVSLALRGNAYGLIVTRDRDGYPTTIEWLHPDDVWCADRAPSGPGSYSQPIWYWQGRVLPAEDLFHIPWFPVPGRVVGLSPIEACATTIGTGVSAQTYTADWFDNGAVPPGEFKNTKKTVLQPEAQEISARLVAAIRRRRPLVYGSDWEYKPIAVAAHEARFVETLKLTATQIAAIFGVPPEMVGGETGNSMTYSNEEQHSIRFLTFTLRPWLELIEAAMFRLFSRPTYVKFNADAMVRTDLTTRAAWYRTARDLGLLSVDEIRAYEELPPLPNGQGGDYAPLGAVKPTPAGDPALPQPRQIRAVS